MTIKLKIYDNDVVINNNIAQTNDKGLEKIINQILEIDGFSVSLGFVPQLFETFGKNIELVEVIEDEQNAIY